MPNLNVLISTYLEPEFVERIATAHPSARLLYEPDLLPRPRYACDHTGTARDLDPAQQRLWESMLSQADVAFDFDWQSPALLPQRAPRLGWIQATSAGIGAFMQRTGLTDSGIVVTTAAGIHATPLAEFALAGALHFIKGIDELRRRQQAAHWQRYTTASLAGRNVTVVGLGGMGKHVATVFHALGAKVTAVGRGRDYGLPAGVQMATTADLERIIPGTQVLVLCCALTPQTENLIDKALIQALPTDAVVVNISRGQVIDEDALIEALRTGNILGAALDVFHTEPLPPSSPLWNLPNVLVSPHSASTVATENELLTDLFIDNLRRRLAGEPLRNTYQRELGY